ncbi:MAG TPA: hypothetical protein VFC96_01955, partial [Anaerovoracaceae bacterium]|nr:hypothetical protein [Anaerovoracaceae bacterium]
MRGRLLSLFTIIVLLLSALIVRLSIIQLIDGGEYRRQIRDQSYTNISEIPARGTVYDRDNRPLTNVEDGFFFIIDESRISDKAEELLNMMHAKTVGNVNSKYRIYSTTDKDKTIFDNLCSDYGAVVVKHLKYYSEKRSAMHIVGCTDQEKHIGLCGIEKDYDSILSLGKTTFSIRNDGQGHIISGKGVGVQGDRRRWGVLTTIDSDKQYIAETVLYQSGKKGAVVILDIKSGEVLASVSSPAFDPVVDRYDEASDVYKNRAISKLYRAGPLSSLLNAAATAEGQDIISAARLLGLLEEAVADLSGQAVISEECDELMLSPMQAARMTRIIAAAGKDSCLTLIKGTVEGIKGAFMFPRQPNKQAIPAETAEMLRQLLTGLTTDNVTGNWYTGYIPIEEPQFVITVYVEGINDTPYA